ncbi:MAG: 4-aminobutyrate aminotransferase-like enzyme [Gammaproteobacteria bacterium]|jgi:4-aminobutyrate aminotransferase-like enzyme
MNNKELLERRYRLMGAGAPLFYDEPVHIVRGEGVYMYDADGRQYLDVYNNVPHVGHCHPHIVAALAKQAETLNVHSRYLHETVLDYTERLTATFDSSLSMAVLTCTGTESNEVALRMARHHSGKMGIICSNFTYHGNSTAVWELATTFHDGGESLSPNVRAVPFPDAYRPAFELQGDDLWEAYADEVKRAIESFEAEGIGFAGLIFCPIFSGEGLPDVPPLYMQKVMEHVHKAGGLFISDEVQAGFGRTGDCMWGHQLYGITPDIVTLGKPMGNGHPIGGVVAKADLLNEFRDTCMYFNTFGSNPVSCAVGMAVLDVLEQDKLLQNAVEVSEYVKNGLGKLQDKHDLIGDVRGRGLFFGADLVSDRTTKKAATAETKRVVNEMRNRGILISKIGPHDNVLKMRPPMPFSKDNADQLLSTLDEVLAGV